MVCTVNDIFRRAHQLQDRHTEYDRHDRHDHCKNRREVNGVHHKATHALIVSCAEFVCQRNRKSVAHSHTESDDKEVDGACGTYRCKVIYSKKTSYDQSIH